MEIKVLERKEDDLKKKKTIDKRIKILDWEIEIQVI